MSFFSSWQVHWKCHQNLGSGLFSDIIQEWGKGWSPPSTARFWFCEQKRFPCGIWHPQSAVSGPNEDCNVKTLSVAHKKEKPWVPILAKASPVCRTLSKLGNPSEPQYFHLSNEDDDTSFMVLLKQEETHKMSNTVYALTWLTWKKHSIHVCCIASLPLGLLPALWELCMGEKSLGFENLFLIQCSGDLGRYNPKNQDSPRMDRSF